MSLTNESPEALAGLMDKDDQRITRYLTGDLPEAERAELERQYFGDATLVDRVIEIETQLLDAYARGQLSDEMRQRVSRHYLANPAGRDRLKFADAFIRKVDDLDRTVRRSGEAQKSWGQGMLAWWPGYGRVAQFSMALAILLLVVATGGLYVERFRLREDLKRVQAAREQRERDLQQQLTTERQNTEAAIGERDRLRAQQSGPMDAVASSRSTPAVVSLLFAVGGVRAPDGLARRIKIPSGTRQVRLELSLKENVYSRYGIALRAVGGTEISARQGLLPAKTESGWLLVLTVPADRLGPGDYLLAVSGVTRGGDRDDVSTSIFRVEK